MNNSQFFINLNLKKWKINFIIISSGQTTPLFTKDINIEKFINNKKLLFENIDKLLKEIILEIERKFQNIFVNKVNLMIENISLNSIDLALKENMENKSISKSIIEYLIKDARYQIIKNHPEKHITHIIIKKCLIDGEEYNYVPFESKCKNFIVDLSFIYLQKTFTSEIEKVFKNHQLEINKIICTNYAKSLLNIDIDNVSKAGLTALEESNLNEVSITPKKKGKMGFFEKVFHIFS